MTQRAARKRATDPDSAQPPRQRRLALFKLIAVGGATALILVIGEIAVRVFDLGPEIVPIYAENFRLSSDPELGYELVPGSEYKGGTISSRGLRDREYAIPKPAGTFRIACVGDSICFGYDVRPEETLSSRLEALLNELYADDALVYEVLNFGVTGYNVDQIVRTVTTRVLDHDPDLIVYAYSINDPQEYSTEQDALLSQLTGAQRNYVDRMLRPGTRMAARSRLYLLARYVLEQLSSEGQATGEQGEDPQWSSLWEGSYGRYYANLHASEEGWGRVSSGLAALGSVSREQSTPTAVVVFPVLRDFAAYPLHAVHTKVADAARAESLHAFDLFPAFLAMAQTPGARFARDFLHPDAPGYSFAAVAVLRELLGAGLLPVADRDVDRLANEPTLDGASARLLRQRYPR
jgi:lysophospholipase L1-like esterase